MPHDIKFFTNQNKGVGADLVSDWYNYTGGLGYFTVWGQLGEGSVRLEASPDGGTSENSIIITGTTVTTPSIVEFGIGDGFMIRAVALDNTSNMINLNVVIK